MHILETTCLASTKIQLVNKIIRHQRVSPPKKDIMCGWFLKGYGLELGKVEYHK